MKIKVGDTVYDGAKEPVMVILEDQDKRNIANTDDKKYASYPDSFSIKEIKKFMKTT